ncbi:IS21 family transposase [Salicibibacter halophilus]|uniref:IS21 family transposase n=1 Tax=Salicibibacter halophilus TaxID=2502791 RepID=A0A514LFN6_9BACI|nr:IS21 family transposase [Salicibibacter halophilus]QDI90224.1 IS21 family transposase [Salicibibacter halophilus]QDI90686.1 IS21 family transposase [Salicibibacter halophilus]QDI91377.1 IS21 family transposase [Salicibibacter halophilus]QDI91384.1 IS21 family transposase [Salicibibacter halophilus]
MITMSQKYQTLMKYMHEGESIRKIARDIGTHRETVSKYVKEYEQKRNQLMEGGEDVDVEALIEALTEKPTYTTGSRPKRKLTPEIEQRILTFLEENRDKRQKGQKKQQKTVMDMYEVLEDEELDISYSTVRRLVRQLEHRAKEAFIKETYMPGDVCEFDWGEVKITVDGRLQPFQMAVFTSAYGNYRWACLFPKQTTECFQEAHARFFAHVGGVHTTLTYDNMRVAVRGLAGEKGPTEGLMQLMVYYGFQHRFCNIRRGNEKGHVERSVDVVRRKAFAIKDTFESLEEANHFLEGVCSEKLNQKSMSQYEGQTPTQRLEQEREHLLEAPPKWDAARVKYARVDKYATVVIEQNRYSVPDHLVGEMIMVKVYAERIRCFYNEACIANHERLSGHHRWNLQLSHVLETLRKKPGALGGSLALHQADQKIKAIYETHYTGRERDFIALCHYLRDEGDFDTVLAAIDQLEAMHPKHVTTDKIKAICARNNEQPITPPSSQDTEAIAEQARNQMSDYDQLFQMTATKEGIH